MESLTRVAEGVSLSQEESRADGRSCLRTNAVTCLALGGH